MHGRFSSYKTLIVSWVLEECSQTHNLMHCSSVLGPTQVRYADGHLNPVPFEAASHVQDCALLFPGRYPAPALQISKDAAPLLETNAIVRFVVRAKGYYDKLAAPDSNDELDKAVEAASREAWMDFALCQAPTEDTGVMGAALKALIDHAVRLPPEERSNAEFSRQTRERVNEHPHDRRRGERPRRLLRELLGWQGEPPAHVLPFRARSFPGRRVCVCC